MKKITFITTSQFGYLVDTFKYCQYLDNTYDIQYICFDMGLAKISLPNVKVHYVPHVGNTVFRGIIFILYCLFYIAFKKSFVFVVYFRKLSWLKRILPYKYVHLDIRTLSVLSKEIERTNDDFNLRKEIKYYNSVSAISPGVIKKLNVDKEIFYLPLGADVISNSNKDFHDFKLLYVGTLYNRRIIDTIIGLKKFRDKNPNLKISYDIVGDGDEKQLIEEYVIKNNLESIVKIHGLIPHDKLSYFFNNANIGVSYIPITDYYTYQPPTKTYEYAFSGLVNIATATESNKLIINKDNGILISDNSESFYEGLEILNKTFSSYDSMKIRNSVKEYSWKNIVEKYLKQILSQNEKEISIC